MRKIDLLSQINQRLAEESKRFAGVDKLPVLKDIRFTIGQVKKEDQDIFVSASNLPEVAIDPKREQDFDRLLSNLNDEEMRVRLKHIWCAQEKKMRK